MLYIDPSSSEIESAKNTHFEHIKCYINKKINNQKNRCKCNICNSSITPIKNLNNKTECFLSDSINLDLLINSEPESLKLINDEFWLYIFPGIKFDFLAEHFNKKNIAKKSKSPLKPFSEILFNNYVNDINKIINYDWFCNKENTDYNAYNLATNLNRNTCTYCNRVYTSTIINKNGRKIMRPTLDHWFPKSDFPLLALSFYNLIPACTNCNSSVKGTSNFNLKEHIHPYIDKTQTNDFSFNYKFYKKLNNYSIHLEETNPNSTKARKTLEAMYIDEMYNSHQSEIDDLIKIKTNYSENYIQSIQELFKHKLTKEEIYRILFGVEYDSEDFHKLPLSKFKNDILKDLKIK